MVTEHRQWVARLDGPRELRLDSVVVPTAGPRDILVQVRATGICGTDISFYRHGAPQAGAVLGHEFAGVVVQVGQGVAGARPGDRIVANPMVNLIGIGGVAGAFAEYVMVPQADLGRNFFVLADSVSDVVGALVEPFAVALHAVNRARAQPGDRVVIFGAGPIGLCILVALRARGIRDILVIEPSVRRSEMAIELGASAAHDPRKSDPSRFVVAHFGGEMTPFAETPLGLADVAFDCAGVEQALVPAVSSLKARGRLVLVADPHDCPLAPLRFVMLRELEVIGSLTYEEEFDEAIRLLAGEQVDLSRLVTHRFPLTAIEQAFAVQMDAEQAIKVMIVADRS